ncbi:MAG: hypothetical protein Q7R69_03700 [bacterium]|nr:hypothetical protein [bacterium]
MKELQRKQKIRRVIYSIPSLVILSVIAFFLAKGAVGVINKERVSAAYSKNLAARAEDLVLREQELKGDIARLETEEGIKDEIRERFSVTEEGEYVAIIVNERGVSSSTDKSALPWYKRFWLVIMGN